MILPLIAAALVFVAVVSVLLVLLNSRSPRSEVERRLTAIQRATAEAASVENVLRSDTGTFPGFRRLVSGTAWSSRAERDLAQAGWGLKVSEYLLIRLVAAVLFAILGLLLFSGMGPGLLFLIVGGVIGFMAPGFVLQYYKAKRQEKINKQLAEMLALISNSLRSGFAFVQAVELATKQLDPPMSDELAHFLRDVSLGAPSDIALQALANRTGSYDLDMMVATILIQRNTGGNLSEILDNVADTVRERERLQGEIKALTASQRFTGFILSIYPLFLGAIFFALAPDIWSVLLEDSLGRSMLIVAGVLQVMGIFAIRRILKLDV